MNKLKSEIVENIRLADNVWRMTFQSSKIAEEYKGAGQFVLLLPDDDWEHPLRRPMSIADVKDTNISIIYKIFGDVTQKMSILKKSYSLNVDGPFGNTFKVDYTSHNPILIGGGIGIAPILNFSNCLTQKGISSISIIGANNSAEHFLKHSPANNNLLCTDDGSIGIHGNVIDALETIISDISNPRIFACGPQNMLKSLKEFMFNNNIPGQFSVDSYMACGIGFCQGCAIPNAYDSYNLVCKDGPVFDINEVRFD